MDYGEKEVTFFDKSLLYFYYAILSIDETKFADRPTTLDNLGAELLIVQEVKQHENGGSLS